MAADSPLKIIQDAIKKTSPELAKRNWREALREQTGNDGSKLWKNIMKLGDGEPISVQLPDGRMSIPILPTPDVQLRANIALAEFGFGRAVLQTEIVKAEQEAKDFEAVRALSEAELDAQIAQLEARNPIDAEFTVSPLDLDWYEVYKSRQHKEQAE